MLHRGITGRRGRLSLLRRSSSIVGVVLVSVLVLHCHGTAAAAEVATAEAESNISFYGDEEVVSFYGDDDYEQVTNMPSITIGIAGGTGAGKSTLARAVYAALGSSSNVTYLMHDDYYRDLSHVTSIEERARTNFDHPDSLETELLVKHIRELKAGRSVDVPTYDFSVHSRTDVVKHKEPQSIVLVEGILIFSEPTLVAELDVKVFVEADSDIRLMRRISRDTSERGRSVDEVMEQYKETVRPMHEEFVEPSKRAADVVVHSDGHGDVALKMIVNHLRVEAGLPLLPDTPATTAAAAKNEGEDAAKEEVAAKAKAATGDEL